MDLAVLRSLLKANKASFLMQLKLALAWNRIDVAKSEIFTEDLKQENFSTDLLYEPLATALLDNKSDFVELFLNEGVNIRHFLTLQTLEMLYQMAPLGSPLRYLLDQHLKKQELTNVIDMYVVGLVIEDLMGDRFKSRYRTQASYTGFCVNGQAPSTFDMQNTGMYLCF